MTPHYAIRLPDDPGPRTPPSPDRFATANGRALLCIVSFLVGLAGGKATVRAETVDGARITIIDGDTIALPCAQPAPGCAERVRILNIDTPETGRNAACPAEATAGLAAKEALRRLIASGPVVITRCEPETGRCTDHYGRTLARLATATGDIGQAMIASGHALPWAPGAAAKFQRQQHWCGRR